MLSSMPSMMAGVVVVALAVVVAVAVEWLSRCHVVVLFACNVKTVTLQ